MQLRHQILKIGTDTVSSLNGVNYKQNAQLICFHGRQCGGGMFRKYDSPGRSCYRI